MTFDALDGATVTALVPWITVDDATAAVDFYRRAFGALVEERMEQDAVVQVARLTIGGAPFWVQRDDVASEPSTGQIRMVIEVADPDAMHRAALDAGATEVKSVAEEHGWRSGRVVDPFGVDWESARRSD